MEAPIVVAAGLSKTFALQSETVQAVVQVDVTVERGEMVCILGDSGSGKTTLLNLFAGLERPTDGSLHVCGADLAGMDADDRAALRLRRVGVVFQDHNLLDEFTALENVLLPLEVAGWDREQARSSALDRLDRVGIRELADRYPRQLSGGQRQRVGIARALVGERELLVADEPTGALDSANSMQLFRILRTMCDDGHTVVLATHELRATEFADRTLRMSDGALATAS